MDTQAAASPTTNPTTGRVFTTPAVLPTNEAQIGKPSDHRIDVSKPRTAHETGLRNDANEHRRDSAARRLLLSPTKCRVIIQLDNSLTEDLQLRQLRQDRAWQQTTITSTTRAVWSRGKPSNQPTPTTPPPNGKLLETHPQIPRPLLADHRRHFYPPRMAPLNHITFGPAAADPVHNTSASFHILDGERDPP
jgi:hypothetical protein